MQVARRVEVWSAPSRPGRDNRVQEAKPALRLSPGLWELLRNARGILSRNGLVVTPRLVRPPVVHPSACVAAPLVACLLGMLGVARRDRFAVARLARPSSPRGGSCGFS